MSENTTPDPFRAVGGPLSSDDIRSILPYDVQRPPIRQSGIKAYYECQRKYLWSERLGIEHIGHKAALFIGTLFHLAQTARYRGRDDQTVNYVVDSAAADYIERNREHAAKVQSFDYSQSFVETCHREAAIAKVMSQLHWELHPMDTSLWEVVDTEGEYTLQQDGVLHGGRLDLVLRRLRPPHGLVIVDHKTARDSTAYARTLEEAVQTRLYRILLKANTDEPVLGFQYDIIQKPTIRLKKRPPQTFADYLTECREWYQGEGRHEDRADKIVGAPPILQKPIFFSEPLWPADFVHMRDEVADAARRLPLLSNFPKTGQSIGKCEETYGGKCPFYNLCYASPQEFERVALTQYRTRVSGEMSSDPSDLE